MKVRLEELEVCFQGIIPAAIATCDSDGEPNVTYLSQVHLLGPDRVALSCQFFNKTKRNVLENARATVLLLHPLSFESYRLQLRFDHAETEGPLFDTMSARIDAIASHTGMAGVFELLSADVYEVLTVEHDAGFIEPLAGPPEAAPPLDLPAGPLTELRLLQQVSDRIGRSRDLDELLTGALLALDELFGFSHAMVLLPSLSAAEGAGRLVAVASRGYGAGGAGVGAEVAVGEGLIGTVAAQRRAIRVAGIDQELRYRRAIRGRVTALSGGSHLSPEIPLPGLPDPRAQLALPLLAGGKLMGVLAVESRDPLKFDTWDEAYLQIVANQLAMGIEGDRTRQEEHEAAPESPAPPPPPAAGEPPPPRRTRAFTFYKNDDCLFVDGEYLVRNLPGKILWKLLRLREHEGRVEFTNRELRLDPSLGLPSVKDNLEARLILLRRRLELKCPEVRLAPVRRGRFALELDCAVTLTERACG